MATTSITMPSAHAGILATLRRAHERILAGVERRREYHRTLTELSGLTERELADIGLCRADIVDVARRHLQDDRA